MSFRPLPNHQKRQTASESHPNHVLNWAIDQLKLCFLKRTASKQKLSA